MKHREVSIVIPVYNEEENLAKLLQDLLHRFKKTAEIVVVDDCSSDNTGMIADSYAKRYPSIKVLHRKKGKNGMGAALKDGTRAASGKFIVWVMGDNSDDLSTIPLFINKLKKGADMVFGSRYMDGGSSGDLSPMKALLSSGFTRTMRAMFGIQVHDITNAFRAFRKEVFDSVHLHADDFSISPEFAIKAHVNGFALDEVPTTYKNRTAGKQKFRMLKMGIAYCKLFKYRLRMNE